LTVRHSGSKNAVGLLDRLRSGDLLAVARAITAIENETELGAEISNTIRANPGKSRTLGVTGPPGAGKSSLINALIKEFLTTYRRVGILTVDPSSPVTGGAVLGDRVRMGAHSGNPNVFIRSLAARGHLGGVTRMTGSVLGVLAAAGLDLVVIETVGTGQSEVEIADLAEVSLVVCPPGLGDEMQSLKAGVLEIADLFVVNKADLPGAERTAMLLKTMLSYRGHDEALRVKLTSTVTGAGLPELVAAIEKQFHDPAAPSKFRKGRSALREPLADYAAKMVSAYVRDTQDHSVLEICEAVAKGRMSYQTGALAALQAFLDASKPAKSPELGPIT